MNKTMIGLSILLIISLVFSGCIQSKAPTNTNTTIPSTPTSQSVVDDLTAGTGTGTNDITSSDLDGLQSDLDGLDVSVDELSQSDI